MYTEDDLYHRVPGSVNRSVGSDASIDLQEDFRGRVFRDPQHLAEGLLQTHPDYDDNVRHWLKYINLYESKDIYRFLHKHFRESSDVWVKRVERGYNFNYVRNTVDLYNAFLFHSPVIRKVPQEFEEYYTDVDNRGTKWEQFVQKVNIYASVEGHCGVLVDLPALPEEYHGKTLTEADRKALNLKPIISIIHAHQIFDWELNKDNTFKWVKIHIDRPIERESFMDKPDSSVKFFQVWTQNDWTEYKYYVRSEVDGQGVVTETQQAEEIARGEHGLGRVPLIIARCQETVDHPFFGLSMVKDIADINIAIINMASLMDEEVYERCLNVLCMQGTDDDRKAQLSYHNVLEYPEGTDKPFYLTPGESPIQNILKLISVARDEILRLGKVNISTGLSDVRSASSGIAHAYQFLETNHSLANSALNMQQVELELHKLMSLVWGLGEFNGAIEYPKDFGVEDTLLAFQTLALAKQNLTSETAKKELEKRTIRTIFSSETSDVIAKMESEIEAYEEEEDHAADLLEPEHYSPEERIPTPEEEFNRGDGNQVQPEQGD